MYRTPFEVHPSSSFSPRARRTEWHRSSILQAADHLAIHDGLTSARLDVTAVAVTRCASALPSSAVAASSVDDEEPLDVVSLLRALAAKAS